MSVFSCGVQGGKTSIIPVIPFRETWANNRGSSFQSSSDGVQTKYSTINIPSNCDGGMFYFEGYKELSQVTVDGVVAAFDNVLGDSLIVVRLPPGKTGNQSFGFTFNLTAVATQTVDGMFCNAPDHEVVDYLYSFTLSDVSVSQGTAENPGITAVISYDGGRRGVSSISPTPDAYVYNSIGNKVGIFYDHDNYPITLTSTGEFAYKTEAKVNELY
jgi:hypothetical protein